MLRIGQNFLTHDCYEDVFNYMKHSLLPAGHLSILLLNISCVAPPLGTYVSRYFSEIEITKEKEEKKSQNRKDLNPWPLGHEASALSLCYDLLAMLQIL